MDETHIEELINEYFGILPPEEKEFIILSVQKELDLHMFNVLRELRARYQVSKSKDHPFFCPPHKDQD